MKWVKHPLILEINTIPWLHYLSEKYYEPITLKNIPEEAMDELAHYNCIWLMGVWKRSETSQQVAREHKELQKEYSYALSDYTDEDIIGSPYAIKNYKGDKRIGGNDGLIAFHNRLNDQKKILILDFVPNHTALDHPWIQSNPELYIHGEFSDLMQHPELFAKIDGKLIAHGKDPYFLPWTDTLQLNAFSDEYRKITVETLLDIQQYCEGVRCDMAMLMVNSVFQKTWTQYIKKKTPSEFWEEVIPQVKRKNQDFKFIAEVYWDMEWELMKQGFDYCYDKTLYDRILYDPARSVRGHLQAEWEYLTKLVRFIENHDEKRAVTSFGIEESRAAACIALCLPGGRMIHFGQQFGFTKKLPVQLRRWSKDEEENAKIKSFYEDLTPLIHDYLTESNLWNPGRVYKVNTPGPENPMISYYWNLSGFIIYVIVNFSPQGVHCILDLSTLRQDIEYEVSTLLKRNSENEDFQIEDNKIPLKFGPWGIEIIKLSY